MRVLFYWYALAVRMANGSLHDHDPMHADEPPIMRGDAPPGMFTPRWAELQQTYGIERPRGASCEIFIHGVPQDHGIYSLCQLGTDTSPRLTCGLKNLSMISLDGLMT